jgi:cytochrome c-type biogenesis protein CcmH
VTTVFWLLAASMLLLALLFAIVPLLRSREGAAVSRQRLNTELIKQQLRELQADLDAGRLEPEAYRAARHDLERELLDDVEGDAEAPQTERSGRWAMAAFAALIPALAVFLYLQLGAAPMLDRQEAPRPVAARPTEEMGHPLEAMVAKLASRLEEDPDNAEGWVLLGRSYATLNRYREAANAYGQAVRLAGRGHPQLLVDYADVLTMSTGGRFSPQAGELLERALATQPDNPKGLWLMGHYKYQHEDFQAAVDYWRRAADQLPPNSEDTRTIRRQIKQAENRLVASGGTLSAEVGSPSESPAESPPAAGETKSITVTVRLDEALSEKASPQDTVFVFARAAKGPRMPLAIVRKRVSDLPMTVTLDDSLAMSPAMVLSNFDEVTIGARVSKSGNAMPQSGDLQGAVSPVQVQPDASVEVVIDEVKP